MADLVLRIMALEEQGKTRPDKRRIPRGTTSERDKYKRLFFVQRET